MASSRLDAARQNLIEAFRTSEWRSPTVHSVTFQPLEPNANADRIAVKRYNILGQRWVVLALCDGHGGTRTSDYTSELLPPRLYGALEHVIKRQLGGRVDRTNYQRAGPLIVTMLKDEIFRFDRRIGRAVETICPEPHKLSKEASLRLIDHHTEVIERAFQGTTLSMAIVNLEHHLMWAAGVGDSTIALSTTDRNGVRRVERLCELHNFKNPKEYYNTVMSHTSFEKDIVDSDNRLLGWLEPSRAIGDFPLKMNPLYLRHIFQYITYKGSPSSCLLGRVITPPYVTAEPSVRFIDLEPVWRQDPTLLLFSDGIDLIVDGYFVFTPEVHSGISALDVVPALLSDVVEPHAEAALGHGIEPGSSRATSNMAIDVLGNLLGGTNAARLEMVTDRHRLSAPDPIFYIDDTTLVVARLAT